MFHDEPSDSVKVIVTAKDTDERMTEREPIAFGEVAIKTYQSITGFGGSFTEASAYTLSKLTPDKRAEVIKAYFDPTEGLGYTLCRTHINSADFSLGNYAYSEVDGDFELEHFSIDRDKKWLIPMIKDAMAVDGAAFKLFSSPWSPPAWMKTNGQMNYGGQLKEECRDVWARYYARYIKEYAKEGITIWGLTVQNEPAATQTWDSCIYSAEEEGAFVRDHLGPTLEKESMSVPNRSCRIRKPRSMSGAWGSTGTPATSLKTWPRFTMLFRPPICCLPKGARKAAFDWARGILASGTPMTSSVI
jgi:glucosylceramidase